MKIFLLFAFVMSSCAGYASDNFFIPMGITQSTVPVTLHKGSRTLVVTANTDFTGTLSYSKGVKTLMISKSGGKVHGSFTFSDPLDTEEVATLSVKLVKVSDNDSTFQIGQINYNSPILSVKLAGNKQLNLSTQASGEQKVRVTKPDGSTDNLLLGSYNERQYPNLYQAMYNPTQVGKYVFEIEGSLPVVYSVTQLPNATSLETATAPEQTNEGFSIRSSISGPHKIVFLYTLNRKERTQNVSMLDAGTARLNIPGATIEVVSAITPDGNTIKLWPQE